MGYRYRVYVSSRGNLFMAELARLVVAGLSDLGRDATVLTDGLPERGRDTINLVVAPHEFFPLQRGASDRELLEAAAASISISTEQPGTPWFELGQRYSKVGPYALDINEQAVAELRGRGIDAKRLALGYHPSWDCWRGGPTSRPTDVLFLGALTDRRGTFFARSAPQLWDYRCNLRFFDFRVPQAEQSNGFAGGTDKWEQLAASKVLLNVHRDELQYFEWVRILEAIANGCLVISEPSIDHMPLVPGQHFLQVPLEHLADYTVAVMADPALRDEIAAEAYDFVRSKLVFTDMLEPILDELEHESFGRRMPAPVSSWRKTATPKPAGRRVDPPAAAPMLQPAVRARIKDLMLDEIGLLRRLEAMYARLRYGSAEYATDETTPAFPDVDPDTTVVVSLYNYEQHVAEAIDSVVKSAGVVADLVIVDDNSRDHSRDVVRSKMAEYPWFPIRLIAKAANQGLSAARNTGFELARASKVFVLDADNAVYPTGLAKLSAALEDSDAAGAYGIIACHGARDGLVSCLPWAVELLTVGNYIDAMAMIRRSAWQEIGGYDPAMDALGGGWEDYDFFLRLATNGQRAILVPEIVASYRAHPTSMLATVNLDTAALMSGLRERYPFLPWGAS